MIALIVLNVFFCSINSIACAHHPGTSSWQRTELPPFHHNPPQQSPIDIRTRQSVPKYLPDLRFLNPLSEYAPITVTNDGKGVALTMADEYAPKPRMFGGPLERIGQFAFANLHFHWGPTDYTGSEHEINGYRLAMETHIVHFNYKYGTVEEAMKHADGLAVVGFLLEACEYDNPEFERLVRVLPSVEFPEESVTLTARELLGWLPAMWQPRGYFTYPGSLTTPAYAENVIWIVYPEPIYISSRQVQFFRQLVSKDGKFLRNHSRPVQPLNRRTVVYAAEIKNI